jgi:RimJ/RimL family protein N-acetyltransferase
VHAAVVESLDALRAWPASLPWAAAQPSVAASQAFCRDSAAAFATGHLLTFLAFDRQGHFVLTASLLRVSPLRPQFEVGYWCRTSCHSQGYTTEAVKALLGYALGELGAERITAKVDELNKSSRAVCELSGMTLVRTMLNESFSPSGELRHACVYATGRGAA